MRSKRVFEMILGLLLVVSFLKIDKLGTSMTSMERSQSFRRLVCTCRRFILLSVWLKPGGNPCSESRMEKGGESYVGDR